jgi:hypothetical protein
MAQARVSFVPSFVSFVQNMVKPEPVAEVKFTTTRTGKDRVSAATTIEAMHFDQATKTIKVFCADGNLRECRIERLTSVADGRDLWKKLQTHGRDKTEVKFVAAGGFSPDKWFYTVE